MAKAIHHGHNVRRFREMRDLKQEALALELGNDWTQRRISLLEQKEEIEPDTLEQVAKVLKVPADIIRNFDEDSSVLNIQNNYEGSNNQGGIHQYHCTFNPIDKWMEALEENKKLYERLLLAVQEKNDLLQKQLDTKG